MYCIVEISGHQYKVSPGDLIDVNKLGEEADNTVEFDKVLFVSGDAPKIGLPTVNGAKVVAKLIKHDRERKKIVFRRSPGRYRKKRGHRQHYSALLITEISDGEGNVEAIDKDSAVAKKFLS